MLVMGLNNERGVTLVELLAAIVLTSIIGVIGYSILSSGFSTYDRVKEESGLRDEADLIISSLINELYPLKISDIQDSYLPENKTNNYYLQLKDGQKIGFIDNSIYVKDRYINLTNSGIKLSQGTKIERVGEGRYKVTLVLVAINSGRKLETISEIGLINDTLQEEGE